MPDTTTRPQALAADTPAAQPAQIVRTLGPFPGVAKVNGVTHDGRRLWVATGDRLLALDPANGAVLRELPLPCDAGSTFDGQHLWQLAEARIHRIDPATGALLGSIPAPGQGRDSGLAWAEGSLWVGQYRERCIHRIDPASGAVLRTIRSDRFVTGVSWADGALWHGTWEGDESDLRRVDPATGAVQQRLQLPAGTGVSGLEADDGGLLWCGGGASGTLRAVRRPPPPEAAGG